MQHRARRVGAKTRNRRAQIVEVAVQSTERRTGTSLGNTTRHENHQGDEVTPHTPRGVSRSSRWTLLQQDREATPRAFQRPGQALAGTRIPVDTPCLDPATRAIARSGDPPPVELRLEESQERASGARWAWPCARAGPRIPASRDPTGSLAPTRAARPPRTPTTAHLEPSVKGKPPLTEPSTHAEERLPGRPGEWVAKKAAPCLRRVVQDR